MIDIHCHFPVIERSHYYWTFKLTREYSGRLMWEWRYGLYVLEEILYFFPNSFLFEKLRDREPITIDGNNRYYEEGDLDVRSNEVLEGDQK